MQPLNHAWTIDEREYSRQEERRGRRHAYARLVPARTALVVVDLVPFFVEDNPYARGIVPRVNALAAELRGRGGTVAWVLPQEGQSLSEEFWGAEVAALFGAAGGTGPLRERLWSGLAVEDADLLVEKSASSAFFPGRCDLPQLLEARGVDAG